MGNRETVNIIIEHTLQDGADNDIMDLSEVSGIVVKTMRKKEIETRYANKIKTRKDGKQFYVYINRKQITAVTKEGLYEKLYEMEYGRFRATLEELFPQWLIWRRDYTNISSKSLREYVILWKTFLEKEKDFISTPITDIKTKTLLNLFRKWTKDGTLPKKRFANIKSLLNGIYQYSLEELEIIEMNPIRNINTKRLPFKPVNNSNDVFTVEERKKLLDHLQGNMDIYALAICFDFHMILRISELLALKWSSIQGDYIRIQGQKLAHYEMRDDLTFETRQTVNVDHIKGKTDEGYRNQILTPKTKEILEMVRAQNPDGEYIFMKNGKQLYMETFNKYLRNCCSEVNIKRRSSHKVRFTVASILYTEGVPLMTLQKMLGHTTAAMTMHYLRQVNTIEESAQVICDALG